MSFDIEIFTVEFVKLTDGHHEFIYQIDKTFFDYYANTDVHGANLKVDLSIEKNGNMMIADIYTHGDFICSCDRCLKDLTIPIEAEFKIIYHLNSEHVAETEIIDDLNSEVVYLTPQEYKVNIAQAVYESSLMDIPMMKTCDDFSDSACDQIMLDKLNGNHSESNETPIDPRWEKLKNIFKNEE